MACFFFPFFLVFLKVVAPYFVELPPFLGFLFSKALEDGGHDLVKVLAMFLHVGQE